MSEKVIENGPPQPTMLPATSMRAPTDRVVSKRPEIYASVGQEIEEHLRILELLGVSRAVVALTKRDVAGADLLELALLDVETHLEGSAFEEAPVVAVDSLSGAGLEELDHTRQAVRDVLTGDTAGVERTHGQLCSRLTDRLCSDNADSFADIYRGTASQIAAIAFRADADLGIAGQNRTHADFLNPRTFDFLGLRFIDFVIDFAEKFARLRMLDVFKQRAAENNLRQGHNDLA